MTDEVGLSFGIIERYWFPSDHTGTVQNQLHCWRKKSAVSCFWVKLFKSLIWMSRWAIQFCIIDGCLQQTIPGKITEIDNNKVKMVISMFGNDKVAEVNLNQIKEL